MYSEKVMDHFEHPRNVGEIENPSGMGTVGNARCGDIMRIYLDIDDQQVIRPMICHLIAPAFQHQLQPEQDVPAEAADGLAAHGKVLAIKRLHSPEDEGQRHADSLSRSDRAVGNHKVIPAHPNSRPPPMDQTPLLV